MLHHRDTILAPVDTVPPSTLEFGMPRSPSRPESRAKRRSGASQESTLRLIGGNWRSRKLPFREIPGLRPTPDRVRETLFNWLAPTIPGARCLDLFAGTGALGLEAMSRGADETWFVESHAGTAAQLQRNLALLDAQAGHVWPGDALQFLAQPPQAFDVIFLDPPFRQDWLNRICPLLATGGWVRPGGHIYLEYERENPPGKLPPAWHSLRRKEAGQVSYQLLRNEAT